MSVLPEISAKNRVPAELRNEIIGFCRRANFEQRNAQSKGHEAYILSSFIKRVTSVIILEAVLLLIVEMVGTTVRGLACIFG